MKIKHNRKHNLFSTLLPLGLVLIQICMLVGVMAAIIVCSAGAASAQEQPGSDFGDAPDSYGTLLASNGARHTIVSGHSLGPIVDAEPDGQAAPLADGDDLSPPGAPDDEDGVTLPPAITAGDPAAIVIVDGGPSGGMLDAWIDFNGNGVFDHPAEHLWGGVSHSLIPGPNPPLTFPVPASAVPGPTYARFRLSISGGLAPTGSAPDGEVEDYLVGIAPAVGNITIAKEVPGGSSRLFEFGGDLGGFKLADGYAGTQYHIPASSYTVTEVVPADWALIDVTCEGGDSTPYSDSYGEGVTIHLDTGEHITCTFTNEQNQPPTADPNGPYLGAAGSTITFDGNGSSDPNNDTLTYAWDYGDGNSGTGATPSHAYSDAGIYDVCLTVNDGHVDSAEKCTIAVVYDPGAGFVTGGGWIDSPAGAYVPDPSLTGKANFGFVSKYKKGATVPTGNTEFQFKTGDLNFHSSSYDWLVVTGSNYAKFKGAGTINGGLAPSGEEYKFKLWAGDGTGGGGADTFRIKIWWEENDTENVVYDNGREGSGYENGQPIGGGSIVVHTRKK